MVCGEEFVSYITHNTLKKKNEQRRSTKQVRDTPTSNAIHISNRTTTSKTDFRDADAEPDSSLDFQPSKVSLKWLAQGNMIRWQVRQHGIKDTKYRVVRKGKHAREK
jgi:hypothetical protein